MKFSPRLITILRALLLAFACLGTAAALFVLVENWRGDRAWAAAERELQAKGEALDFAALRTPPVPDDENFFKAPKLAPLIYERPDDPARKKLLNDVPLAPFRVDSGFLVERRDFAAMREKLVKSYFFTGTLTDSPIVDVLTAMEPLRPVLDEVREAARRRPRSALEPRATPFETIAADTLHLLGQALGVRAAAEIELQRADEAYADLIALQRLANALAAPPTNLLQVMISLDMHGTAAGPVSRGCELHLWTDAQLAAFQRLLADFQPLARFGDAMRSERAGFLYVLDTRPREALGEFRWPRWLFHGWLQQNKVAFCRRLNAELLAAFTIKPERIFPERLAAVPLPRASSRQLADLRHPYDGLADAALNNVGNILRHYGENIDRIRLHGVAWGIERHHLSRSRNPAKLEDLVPDFLPAVPSGIFDGQPMRFGVTADGRTQLYSLGKNGRDDGGKDDDITLKLPDAP